MKALRLKKNTKKQVKALRKNCKCVRWKRRYIKKFQQAKEKYELS